MAKRCYYEVLQVTRTIEFEEIKKFDNEFFDIGLMSFLPRECQLTEDEILGAGNPYA